MDAAVHAFGPAALAMLLDDAEELLRVGGLLEEVIEADHDGEEAVRRPDPDARDGDQHRAIFHPALAQLARELEAILARHLDVEDADVRVEIAHQAYDVGAVVERAHVMALVRE